jgi:hypothetical protein
MFGTLRMLRFHEDRFTRWSSHRRSHTILSFRTRRRCDLANSCTFTNRVHWTRVWAPNLGDCNRYAESSERLDITSCGSLKQRPTNSTTKDQRLNNARHTQSFALSQTSLHPSFFTRVSWPYSRHLEGGPQPMGLCSAEGIVLDCLHA